MRNRQRGQELIRQRLIAAAERAVRRRRPRDRARAIRELQNRTDWGKATKVTRAYVVGWLAAAVSIVPEVEMGVEDEDASEVPGTGAAGEDPKNMGVLHGTGTGIVDGNGVPTSKV